MAVFGAVWGKSFLHAYNEYGFWRKKNQVLTQKIKKCNEEFTFKKRYLRKAMYDPTFKEHLIRERLGYVKSNEYIVRFLPGREKISANKKQGVQF